MDVNSWQISCKKDLKKLLTEKGRRCYNKTPLRERWKTKSTELKKLKKVLDLRNNM